MTQRRAAGSATPAETYDSAPTIAPRLSKSTYLTGSQCHLRLWRDFHAHQLAAPVDEALQLVFDTGHEVGELACRRYPGGHLIAHDHQHVAEALAETREVIDSRTAPAIFEGAFEHEQVLVRPDVLERLPEGGWRLVEVKSTTRPKDVHVLDVAVQLWVLRGVGVDVREAAVLTLNRGYVYDGAQLDVDALFKLHSVLDEASALLDGISPQAREQCAPRSHGPRRRPSLPATTATIHTLAPTTAIAPATSRGRPTASPNCLG